MDRAPAAAEPRMAAGMTRSGSLAANGMAPSVMKDSPSTPAALPASRSAWVKRLPPIRVAILIRGAGSSRPP